MVMSSKGNSRQWLREASLRRVSAVVKNTRETLGAGGKLKLKLSSTESLEPSGLSPQAIGFLRKWIDGAISGRECMLALLDLNQSNLATTEGVDASVSASAPVTDSTLDGSMEFQPLDLIRSVLQLPCQFLCDSGLLYETLFSRAPSTVVREAVDFILERAYEQNSVSLGLLQINLTLKQLKIDALCHASTVSLSLDELRKKNEENNDGSSDITPRLVRTGYDMLFHVQLLIQLLHLHVEARIAAKKSSGKETSTKSSDCKPSDTSASTQELSLDVEDLKEYLSTPLSSFQKTYADALTVLRDSTNANTSPSSLFSSKPTSSSSTSVSTSFHSLSKLVSEPQDADANNIRRVLGEELEASNNVLKPYLRRLAGHKAHLHAQLTELRDNRAFLALGLYGNATENEVKKAYRNMAIRHHPDKPGGDKEKFQQLQVAYQEVLKKCQINEVQSQAMKEMDTCGRQMKKGKKSTQKSRDMPPESTPVEDSKLPENSVDNEDLQANTDASDLSAHPQSKLHLEPEQEEELMDELFPNRSKSNSADQPDEESVPVDEDNTDSPEVHGSSNPNVGSNMSTNPSVVVEDVESDEEYEEYKSNGGMSATEILEKSYPFPVPSFERESESNSEHAAELVKHVNLLISLIQRSLTTANSYAQRHLKWKNQLDRAFKLTFPSSADKTISLFSMYFNPNAPSKDEDGKDVSSIVGGEVTLSKVVPYMELIVDLSQRVASLAMELASECGTYYASQAALDSNYLRLIEQTMNSSVHSLKAILPLHSAHEQFIATHRRYRNTSSFSESEEITKIFLDMIRSTVKHGVATLCGVMDGLVRLVTLVISLRDGLVRLDCKVKASVLEHAKRQLDQQARDEASAEYSPEDLEEMRQAREREYSNTPLETDGQKDKKSTEGDSGSGSEEGRKKDPLEILNSDFADTEGGNSLAQLQDRIHLLQVQLKLQQVQALQNLNQEIISMQSEIFSELNNVSLSGDLCSYLSEKEPIFRSVTGQLKTPPAELPTTSNGRIASELYDSIFSPERQFVAAPSRKRGDKNNNGLSDSLCSLTAEFIDASLAALRTQLLQDNFTTANSMDEGNASTSVVDSYRSPQQIRDIMSRQFAWLQMTCGENFDGRGIWAETMDRIFSDDTTERNDDSTDNPTQENPPSHKTRIALLPDYRSKTLYFTQLVDGSTVQAMVREELYHRLKELLGELSRE